MSGSFESVRWNACLHRLDLGLYSNPKEFQGNGVRTHFNSKGKIPCTRKKSPQRRIEPTTPHQAGQQAQLPTSYFVAPPPLSPPSPPPPPPTRHSGFIVDCDKNKQNRTNQQQEQNTTRRECLIPQQFHESLDILTPERSGFAMTQVLFLSKIDFLRRQS